jgi:FMN phosphatase YigB (HAD superfamily)
VFGALAAPLWGIAPTVAADPRLGWLSLKLASPMPRNAYFAAKVAAGAMFSLLVHLPPTMQTLIVSWLEFTFGRWLGLTVTMLAAIPVFSALGFALGCVTSPSSAAELIHFVAMPMAIPSGLWIPIEGLPAAARSVARFLPAYHVSQMSRQFMGLPSEQSVPYHVGVLSVMTALAVGAAIWVWRRKAADAARGARGRGGYGILRTRMLKTIILDLGKTIIPFDYTRGYAGMSVLSGLGLEQVKERVAALELMVPFESGQVSPAEFRRRVLGAVGVSMPDEEFDEIWSSIFLPETLLSEEFVAGLKRRHRLVLLSNTNAIHFDMVKANYPVLRHFDAYVLSHEVKAMKPSPAIYEAAIAAAHCRAGECFFADDVAEYVEGARRAGIDAVQFVNEAQLAGELRQRGVAA